MADSLTVVHLLCVAGAPQCIESGYSMTHTRGCYGAPTSRALDSSSSWMNWVVKATEPSVGTHLTNVHLPSGRFTQMLNCFSSPLTPFLFQASLAIWPNCTDHLLSA